MTILIALGAIATVLGSLGGVGAFLSALQNRRLGERSATVSELHELNASRSELLDELRDMRALDHARFTEEMASLSSRVTTAEERLDHCEEEKAEMRELIRTLHDQLGGNR